MIAATPANEDQRLAALRHYKILDTPPEPCFDDIALLASTICETPIGILTLVDTDRQWFKAKVGL
ncbi:MAG: putative anti-sigma regulatory factor, serine/threonine protein kinase, partial [Verrucomicrobiaceae bacterium]|nr:putative anti-sigma regulatory factor, serine/threonine protein kinase [Verrucomicrobiaceae bacterium]